MDVIPTNLVTSMKMVSILGFVTFFASYNRIFIIFVINVIIMIIAFIANPTFTNINYGIVILMVLGYAMYFYEKDFDETVKEKSISVLMDSRYLDYEEAVDVFEDIGEVSGFHNEIERIEKEIKENKDELEKIDINIKSEEIKSKDIEERKKDIKERLKLKEGDIIPKGGGGGGGGGGGKGGGHPQPTEDE